jgi:hypothetical protein
VSESDVNYDSSDDEYVGDNDEEQSAQSDSDSDDGRLWRGASSVRSTAVKLPSAESFGMFDADQNGTLTQEERLFGRCDPVLNKQDDIEARTYLDPEDAKSFRRLKSTYRKDLSKSLNGLKGGAIHDEREALLRLRSTPCSVCTTSTTRG